MCLRVLDPKSYEKIISIPDPDEAWSKYIDPPSRLPLMPIRRVAGRPPYTLRPHGPEKSSTNVMVAERDKVWKAVHCECL
jgi:hypothetical protein